MIRDLESGRVAVIGLDGAVPDLAFDRYADRMPTLSRLREQGAWGRLRSIEIATQDAQMPLVSSTALGYLADILVNDRQLRHA